MRLKSSQPHRTERRLDPPASSGPVYSHTQRRQAGTPSINTPFRKKKAALNSSSGDSSNRARASSRPAATALCTPGADEKPARIDGALRASARDSG
jgi:hypothetical protein